MTRTSPAAALESDLQALVSKHASAARGDTLVRLLDVLAAGRDPIPTQNIGTEKPRFINLNAQGRPSCTSDHVAVYQCETGLIWTASPIGTELDHAQAIKAAGALDLMGAQDWRLPTIQELLSIVDYDRSDPAVDTNHFKGPFGWTWSSTIAKAPAGYAWFVSLSNGNSFRYYQHNLNHALAVRPGQSFGLSA